MDDFRKQFLSDASEKLHKLIAEFEITKSISGSNKSELLRCLHTIKGSAQVFGLKESAVLAHELENLILARHDQMAFDSHLQDGLLILKSSLATIEKNEIQQFLEKIGASASINKRPQNITFTNDLSLPVEVASKLSSQERTALGNEIVYGNTVYCIEIPFEGSAFPDLLKTTRGILDDSGVVVATIPSSNFGQNGVFTFQFLFASSKESEGISKIVEKLGGKITFCSREIPTELRGIVSLAVSHGKEIANALGKSIDFDILTDEIEIPSTNLKLVFESLLHLVRNAVDHGFDKAGTVRIRVNSVTEGISIAVSDDGKGIDLAQIRTIAKEKALVDNLENLSDEATLALIFQSEFSTASQITEISGRGIGLDAVKSSIEKSGGTISVKSKVNQGTSFELFLPTSL